MIGYGRGRMWLQCGSIKARGQREGMVGNDGPVPDARHGPVASCGRSCLLWPMRPMRIAEPGLNVAHATNVAQ